MASSQYWRGWFGLLALAGSLTSATRPTESVRDVQFSSQADVTRVVIALTGEPTFRTERIDNPDRVFFDLPRFVPRLASGKQHNANFNVNDRHIRQIRVAENQPGLTRLVFDVESPDVTFKTTLLSNPPRLVVEFRRSSTPPHTLEKQTELIAAGPPPPPAAPQKAVRHFDPSTLTARLVTRQPGLLMTIPPDFHVYPRIPARQSAVPTVQLANVMPPAKPVLLPPASRTPAATTTAASARQTASRPAVKALLTRSAVIEDPLPRKLPEAASPPATIAANLPKTPEVIPPPIVDNTPVPNHSMIRALGLKVGRIVIDPGHGGQDFGTSSNSGLHEKELVLDVSKRLAVLLRENLGAEVILTRGEDSFVSLEQRTQVANEKKADLFISVHANSSPARSASGIETFYLNFAASPGALDVASRENSSAQKNVHELSDLLQKIARNAKLDESREFANKVQNALVVGDRRMRNRGVKRAPFIVLIGADMPAILTEIGFVSNAIEEANLRKSEFRQAIAEKIFNGVASYSGALNPLQVAQRVQTYTASDSR